MRQIKHVLISKKIEENIKNCVYQDKLPPVRTMAAEFNISSRTLNKALKPLIEKGVIIQNSTAGLLINNGKASRKRTNFVGVFCSMKNPHPQNDVMLKELQSQIEADNYRPLFMNVPDEDMFNDEKFWSSNWLDGYIFAYNSINKETANILNRHGIPFVSANRVPADWTSSWVDFDNESALRNTVRKLIAAGHKRIALDFSIVLMPEYRDYVEKVWYDIVKQEGIAAYCCFACDAQGEVTSSAQKHIDYFMAQAHKPTAIIVWNSHDGVRSIYREKFGNDSNMTLIYSQIDNDNSANLEGCNYIRFSYKEIARELWNLFKKVHADPQIRPHYHNVQVEINFNLPKISKNQKRRKDNKESSKDYCLANV